VLIFFAHPILIAGFVHWRGGDRLTPRKLLLAVAALAASAWCWRRASARSTRAASRSPRSPP